MANQKDIQALLRKYHAGTATPAERAQLEKWYDTVQGPDHGHLQQPDVRAYVKQEIWKGIQRERPVRGAVRRLRRWLPYAAAVLVIAFAGVQFFIYKQHANPKVGIESAYDITPGGNRASLVLADGRTIDLSETHSAIVIGDEIAYRDGTVVANAIDGGASASWLQLTTPKGGTYQVTLPDGSQVWLNSATTLKYPSRFEGNERVVELEGEAYFEVATLAKKGNMPFKVRSKDQEVWVLGTQFNVSAYPENLHTATTLVDGSVKVASAMAPQSPVVLRPGQQSINQQATLTVRDVETAPFVAWKNGFFHFRQTDIREVMNQLSRWYDIEVSYEADLPGETFSGKMERNVSLGNVLDFLAGSGIKYRLAGRHLVVEGLTYQ